MNEQVLVEAGTSKAAARICAAAIELFAERGYGGTSTRDITSHLGMSPGAVYPHFKTKESLLFAISRHGHADALASVTAADVPAETPTARLQAVVSAYVLWHANNSSLARVVQYELRSLSPEHYAEIAGIRRDTTAVFRRILKKGCATGVFACSDTEAAVLAITSLGLDVSRWFPTHAFSDPKSLAERYSMLCLQMLCATV